MYAEMVGAVQSTCWEGQWLHMAKRVLEFSVIRQQVEKYLFYIIFLKCNIYYLK